MDDIQARWLAAENFLLDTARNLGGIWGLPQSVDDMLGPIVSDLRAAADDLHHARMRHVPAKPKEYGK
jgi:hypothetical protein